MKRVPFIIVWLALAASALAGQSYTAIVGAPPAYWTRSYFVWQDTLLAARVAECPVARGTTYYINQSGAGNSTGGGGAGTLVSPWLCAVPSDVSTLIHAQASGGNKAFDLRRGDVFAAASAGTGITLSDPDITVTYYSDGTAGHLFSDPPPEITGFKAAYAASGWTQVGATNVWYRLETDAVKWVRQGKDPDKAWTHAAPSALDNANFPAGSWWHDTAGALGTANRMYTRLADSSNPNSASNIQACVGTAAGSGISISANGVRVHGLRVEGWGLATSVLQNYGIQGQTSGTNCYVVSFCEVYWSGSTHAGGHYLGSGSGGIGTWIGNRLGLCEAIGGSATVLNHFSDSGGGEYFNYGNSITHGSLKDAAVSTAQYLGQPTYSHTTSGTTALYVQAFTTGPRPGSAFGVSSSPIISNVPALASRDDYASIRCFFVGDTFEEVGPAGAPTDLLGSFARINCTIRWKVTSGSFSGLHAGTGGSRGGAYVNCDLRLDLSSAGIAAGSYCGWVNLLDSGQGATFWNCRLDSVLTPGLNFYIDVGGAPTNMAGSLWLNSVVLARDGDKSTTTFNGATNQDPTTSTGGTAGCSFAGFIAATVSNAQGYNAATVYTELADSAEGLAAVGPASAAGLRYGAGRHPQGWELEYDAMTRYRTPGRSAAGPGIDLSAAAVMAAPAALNRSRGWR